MSKTNVFDVVPELSRVGAVTLLQAVASGAVCGAVFAEHAAQIEYDPNIAKDHHQRAIGQMELYNYAKSELLNFLDGDETSDANRYERAMTLDEAIEFAGNNATDRTVMAELPEELLSKLGLTKEQVSVIDAQERRRRQEQAVQLRKSVRENAEAIKAELDSFDGLETADSFIDNLPSETHGRLFQKVAQRLAKRISQLVSQRDRYEGWLADTFLINDDIKKVDAKYKAFLRENRGGAGTKVEGSESGQMA